MIAVLAISGCGGDMSPTPSRVLVPGQSYPRNELLPGMAVADTTAQRAAVERFNGAVAGDDPRSVQIGRDMLAAGGTATDAAVAMYFALGATRPSAAGLGASGACLVYDWKANALKAYDFAAPVATGSGRTMAPLMAPRGMFAVHGAHGRLRWAQLVSPAEGLARFGTPVSRALALDLRASEAEIMRDGETARIFGTPAGRVLNEGQNLMQPELAAMLSAVRQGGPGPLHVGAQARQIADAAAQAGIGTGSGGLRDALPQSFDTTGLPLGDHLIGFMPTYDTRGPYQSMLWALLTLNERIEDAPVGERLHMIADADARAEADYGGVLPAGRARLAGNDQLAKAKQMLMGYSPDRAVAVPQPRARRVDESGTSIAVVDREGQAVACGFTLYKPFGLGRVLPGAGFFPAVAPTADLDSAALSPTIVWNTNTKQVFFAGAGSGVAGATGVVITALQTVLGKFELEAGMGIPRLHHPGTPNAVLIEKTVGQDARGDLSSRGYQMQEVERFGPLNAIACTDGLPRRSDTCVARNDPRASGLALVLSR